MDGTARLALVSAVVVAAAVGNPAAQAQQLEQAAAVVPGGTPATAPYPPGTQPQQTQPTPAQQPSTPAAPAQTAPPTAPKVTPEPASSQTPAGQPSATTSAPPAPSASQIFAQVYSVYRSNPNPSTYAELQKAFERLLAQVGPKTPSASLLKANPGLIDLGVKPIDAGNGRIFVFTRVPDPREVVMQWAENKPTITFVGRRHRIKKVTYTTVWHVGTLTLPPMVALNSAHFTGAGSVILVGTSQGSNLWLHTYKQHEGGWVETASQYDSIPMFLTENVCGKVGFRGSDLIMSVARVIPAREEGSTTALPEAESATYRFWLHLSDSGYVLMPHLPDEAQFATVKQLLEAVANGRTDVARTLVSDQHLLSILKYVGLHPPYGSFKVAQMASPPSGAPRFRLITGGKDDLIFEVIHVKGAPIVRAIFIASPDPFLQELASHLPAYDKVNAPPANPDQISSEKH